MTQSLQPEYIITEEQIEEFGDYVEDDDNV